MYKRENKDKILIRIKKYYNKNKNRINAWKRKYRKNRYKTDVRYNIEAKTRARINSFIRGNKRSLKTKELLGCSWEFYKEYLESLFKKGMTWEKVLNGRIHIDHILPVSKFNIENSEELEIAFAYWNTQPLWAKDNLIKKNKIQTV